MFLSVPATVALLIGSQEIISALFGHGSFSEEGVSNSAKALHYFGYGLPAFALIKVFSSFFFANHDTKTPFYISLVSVLLNILISVYFFTSFSIKTIYLCFSYCIISKSYRIICPYLETRKYFTHTTSSPCWSKWCTI